MDAEEVYTIARSEMNAAIARFYEKAQAADIDLEYIIEDITQGVSEATDSEIELEEI